MSENSSLEVMFMFIQPTLSFLYASLADPERELVDLVDGHEHVDVVQQEDVVQHRVEEGDGAIAHTHNHHDHVITVKFSEFLSWTRCS